MTSSDFMFWSGKEWSEYIKQFKDINGVMKDMIASGIARNMKDAREALNEYLPLEKHLQKNILNYLKNRPDCAVWKAAAGPYAVGGIPDICVVYKGRFFGFEVKRPLIGKISPLQRQMAEKITKAGGRVHFVSWINDVEKALNE